MKKVKMCSVLVLAVLFVFSLSLPAAAKDYGLGGDFLYDYYTDRGYDKKTITISVKSIEDNDNYTNDEKDRYIQAVEDSVDYWNNLISNFNKLKLKEKNITSLYNRTFNYRKTYGKDLPCEGLNITLKISNKIKISDSSDNTVELVTEDEFKSITGSETGGGGGCYHPVEYESKDDNHTTSQFVIYLVPEILDEAGDDAIFATMMHEIGHAFGLGDISEGARNLDIITAFPLLSDSLMYSDRGIYTRYWTSVMDMIQIAKGWSS